MALSLSSDAFAAGGVIPARHTCEGENISPPLRIDGVPPRAKSLMLICDDPDAPNGVFTHWVIYNLPPDTARLEAGFVPPADGDGKTGQGRNDFGNDHYEGPCPPPGDEAHHYYFRLFALDQPSVVAPGATRAQVMQEIQGHIVAQTELMGRASRAGVPAEELGQGTRDWEYEFYCEMPHLSQADQHALSAEAERRLGDLTQGHRDMVGASVAIEPVASGQNQQPFRYRARVVVFIRPENLAASEQDETGEAALDRTLDAIERLVREHRAKRREAWQHETPNPAPFSAE